MSNDNKLTDIDNIKKYILPKFFLNDATITMVKFKDTEKQRAVFKVISNNKTYCLKKVYYNEENLLFVPSTQGVNINNISS